jgi:hypothetical protein
MTNQPLDTAALRALAEALDAWSTPAPREVIDNYYLAVMPPTVLALLDTADRHAALVQAVVSLASYIETMPDEYASKADIARQLRALAREQNTNE